MSVADSDQFQMRYYDTTDADTLTRWMREGRVNQYLGVQTNKEIEGTINIWNGYSRFKCGLTATLDGKRCGMSMIYLMPYRKVAHHGIGHVIVPPKYQEMGIEESLTRNLINLAEKYFHLECLQFELLGHDPLLDVLEKVGCKKVFSQEGYVRMKDKFYPRVLVEKVF